MGEFEDMTVFADFHHAGLLNSLILLFEKRLGGRVYRPIGMEWAEQGFWKVYDHPATQLQYLGIGGATPDGTPPLNEVKTQPTPATYLCSDIDSGDTNKAITFDGFMASHFDIVIASIPAHIEPFRRLCDLHPSHPKLIYQIGNAWNITDADYQLVDGIMASAKVTNPSTKPFVEYHQEFDLSLFNTDVQINPPPLINSFINCFSVDGMFSHDWDLFQRIENRMAGWGYSFQCFGGQCRDGAKHGARELSVEMRGSRFIWHTKVGGDGYGHVIHNAFAVGRPVIARFSQYEGKMARELLIDGDTAINIDNLSDDQIIDRIIKASEPETYQKMCDMAYKRFREVVDFEREATEIEAFLGQLLSH